MRAGRVACLLFAALVCSTGAAADRVRYNMAWLPQGSQAGVFVALQQGLYAKANLDVQIARGYGGVRTVNEVDQGLFDIGFGDALAVMLNRAQGGDVALIGALYQRYPGGLCYLEPRPALKKPADLAGLTVGGAAGAPVQKILPAWLRSNSVDPKRVRLMQLDPAVVDASLLQGRIDAAECWEGSNRAVIEHGARQAGRTVNWIAYRDFGMDLYGSGFVATRKAARERGPVFERFLRATYQGYLAARADPELAVRALMKNNPALEASVVRRQVLDTTAQLPAGDVRQLAHFETARLRKTRDYYTKVFELGATAPTAESLVIDLVH